MTALLLLLQLAGALVVDSTIVCPIDASTRAPLIGARVLMRVAPDSAWTSAKAAGTCVRVMGVRADGEGVRVERTGYRPRVLSLRSAGAARTPDTLWVALTSVFTSALTSVLTSSVAGAEPRGPLDTMRVEASRDPFGSAARAAAGAIGATSATVRITDARAAGASSTNALLALLPYTSTRTARGETGLSLRGARREQVAITLDGMPLNDPATGLADISDIPLAGLQSATVTLGADPIGAGSGATGGVLALTSSAQRVLSVRTGAFGQRQAEGAWYATTRRAVWTASAAWHDAANDFGFLNEAGESPQRESRINNDERRATLAAGVIGSRAQLSLLASSGERGMVGAANVRAYDADRSHTDRLLLRTQVHWRGTAVIAGARRMQLRYRDPDRPVFDTRAVAWAGDAEWRGIAPAHAVHWRVGGGTDDLSATGGVIQRRRRGFGALQRTFTAGESNGETVPPSRPRWMIDVGARADLIEGQGLLPTGSLSAERRLTPRDQRASLTVIARASNAVRVPTLYDLYFSSPQRLFVRALRPERVALDASTGMRAAAEFSSLRVSVEGSLVARNTHDAIVWFPGNFGWSPNNVGVERVRGGESRVELASHRLSLSAWITAYDATLSTAGLRVPTPYVPRFASGAQLHIVGSRTLPIPMPDVVAVWRGSSARPFTAGPRNPSFELPPVSLVDLTVSQRLRALRHWPWSHADALVALSLENATNARWQSVRGFPSPGRSWAVAFTLQHSPQ